MGIWAPGVIMAWSYHSSNAYILMHPCYQRGTPARPMLFLWDRSGVHLRDT